MLVKLNIPNMSFSGNLVHTNPFQEEKVNINLPNKQMNGNNLNTKPEDC